MMEKAIFPLPCFGSVAWFSRFLNTPEVFIEGAEFFPKATSRNRIYIAGANGPILLTVPILGGRDHKQAYAVTSMVAEGGWKKEHLQSIRSAYGKSPFFEHYFSLIEACYLSRQTSLFEWNLEILNRLLIALKVDKPYGVSTVYRQYPPEEVTDFRNIKFGLSTGSSSQLEYYQPFADRYGFTPGLSVMDLLFNEGPRAYTVLCTKF